MPIQSFANKFASDCLCILLHSLHQSNCSAHRPQTRSSSDALLRSFRLWLMGVPPIPKCQYSLPQINLFQTVLHFTTFFTSIERSAHRPQTRSSSDALLRSFRLWLMGVPPIPKCQYSLPQINLFQTVFAFCYCAELVILYDRAGREGSQGKTLDLRWQKNFGFVWGMF